LYDELTGIQYARQPDPYDWTRAVPVAGDGRDSAASG
jgi:hypothetical protein